MGQKNPNKGNQEPERTPLDDAQIQQILVQYRQIANNLSKSRTEEQIETALSAVFALSDAAQMDLLKALAKEKTTAAADIVLAVNTYAPQKEVRKEARRSLIRLEGSNIYPEWTMPAVMSLSDALGMNAFSETEDDEDDETLDGENVVEHFLSYWGEGEFEAAYDLLATNSPLREELTSEAWIARRQAWATEAEPAFTKVDVGYTLEAEVEDLPDGLNEGTEELDAFWSLEMKNVPSSKSLPELPVATIVLEATRRHWFWASYTFVEEDGALRVYAMRDRGAEALQLPPEVLEARLQQIAEEIHAMSEALEETDDEDEDVVEADEEIDDEDEDESVVEADEDDELEVDIDEVRWFTKQSLHYCDALIAHAPDEKGVYELASQQVSIIQEVERTAAYLTLAAERIPAERGAILRSLGTVYTELTVEDDDTNLGMEEYQEDEQGTVQEFTSRYLPLAEKALRDAIATDNAFSGYVLLAELLITQNKRIDEAKTLFEQAQELAKKPEEKAAVEVGKAQLARLENKPEEALEHYQSAAALAENIPGVWYNIGELQLSLKQQGAAEKSFLKSIEVDPTTTDAYADLATIYIEQDKDTAALKMLQKGLDENPFAADLMAAQAMVYINEGDIRKAEEIIEEAEEIDPEVELVYVVRQVIDMQKEQMRQQQQRSGGGHKSNKPKKKR